ncbi:Zinc transporter 9 [Hondaea fermentalgiana]|uniref:Zinc transporter 9 n=1 Tax=Hondaea fermentalgiana TaxID=2315210 RepID=A0A2R5GBH9_9STRA|nr:Zinc transporter 9 [Hondaea fermentalgiana]|eukprot:GBG27689.1 Zinc transporter 9 [Hondaea fermentalgiana]
MAWYLLQPSMFSSAAVAGPGPGPGGPVPGSSSNNDQSNERNNGTARKAPGAAASASSKEAGEAPPEHAVHGSAVNPGGTSAPPLNWKTVQRALVGNSFITLLKFGVWWQTGSAAMLSEAIHTLADSGNQALLLAGLHQSSNAPDGRFQYGYGRAAFFWALVSALGMFWTGAGVAIFHGGYNLLHPESHAVETSLALWGVLGVSFLVDGWVLRMTLKELYETKPADKPFWKYVWSIRDPFIMAVIMEDMTACTGVILATLGVGATHYTGVVYWDAMASLGIGALLGLVALQLVRMNQQFLLGHAIDHETLSGIRKILVRRPSVEAVYGVQSQWVGPSTFSYKAEVDFDGTYLAAHLEDKYAPLFMTATEREDIEVLMSWYAEDVTRLVEREVRDIEVAIRKKYPAAAFIELEPDSKYSDVEALPRDPTNDSPYYSDEQEEMRRVDNQIARQLSRTSSL